MRTLLVCAAVLVLASGARAQEGEPVVICPDAYTQPELNRCAKGLYEEADADLNRAYRELMRDSQVEPGDAQAYRAAQKQRYRDAQRAWIPFRDAHCEAVSKRYEGGSMLPMVRFLCLAEATRERTTQLRELLEPLGG